MKLFNAFQAVCMYTAWPFLLQWLKDAEFSGSNALLWAGIVAYVVMFGLGVLCVWSTMDVWNSK